MENELIYLHKILIGYKNMFLCAIILLKEHVYVAGEIEFQAKLSLNLD